MVDSRLVALGLILVIIGMTRLMNRELVHRQRHGEAATYAWLTVLAAGFGVGIGLMWMLEVKPL
jgi:hypothetical protein